MKKSKAKARKTVDDHGKSRGNRRWPGLRLPSRFTSRFGSRRGEWQTLGDTHVADLPPPDYKTTDMAGGQPTNGYYGQEKAHQQSSMDQTKGPPLIPLMFPSEKLAGPLTLDTHFSDNAAAVDSNSPAHSHQPAPSFSSTDAAQFGAPLLMRDPNGTLRSYVPVAICNEADIPRQLPDASGQTRRQANRASELSSLSSGFGDDDIIVAGGPMVKPPPPATTNLRQSTNLVGRLSWAQSRRDTVYTQSSEDLPPRFRTVSSWVNQQTCRIKRAQQREQQQDAPPAPLAPGQPGVPGIHNPPVEQSFNMMMPDGEVPRPVEDTMATKP